MWRLIGVRLGFSSELEEFCNKTTKKRILGSFFDILYLKFQGRIFIFFTNKQARVSPLDIEISIESNAEVLIRHLGNVLDINSNGDIGGPCSTQLFYTNILFSGNCRTFRSWQVVLLIIMGDTDLLLSTRCTN